MGLKKYEIITVGNVKRVRALRSWAVGDRYVNIGDVGGIVYDEKTLSQDGACWLFRGNFGFPGARIGGDSIVDVGEVELSATGAPNVDILGSSVVVGSKLQFSVDQTSADAVVLTAADFEQGTFASYVKGQKLRTVDSATYIRTKNPIFLGGKSLIVKCGVPGFIVTGIVTDADGYISDDERTVQTTEGGALALPAGQYFSIVITKNPAAATVPADATTAQITFTGTYETKLSIIDSRVEINPAISTGTSSFKVGGSYSFSSGAKYPETIIRNSKVSVNVPGATSRLFRLIGQIIGSTAVLDATAGDLVMEGTYSNVKNLTASGVLTAISLNLSAYNLIQATDCDNFTVSPTIFSGLAAAQTANMPFIFQGCNVPNGIFYHHAKIANTYKNIDFALAQSDLGKAIASGEILVSSEVEGMYRLYSASGLGALVESRDSVKSVSISNIVSAYGTTIYKDAYLNGLFDFAGTNVFGNKARSYPLAQVLNVQPRAVQGRYNTVVVGETITGVDGSVGSIVCTSLTFRLNGPLAISIKNVPTGVASQVIAVDHTGKILALSSWISGDGNVSAYATYPFAYVMFRKGTGGDMKPEDLAGVTVTVYNGCKIVNTGETVVNMKGNIRVEDNATLTNCSIIGSGYFGGKAVASGLLIEGSAFMKDNASFTKTAGSDPIRDLKMTENAYAVLGNFALNGRIQLSDNVRFTPTAAGLSEGDLVMKGNAVISGAIVVGGILTMKDNAKVSAGTLTAYGDITLCGSFNQTVNKTWAGKRVIDNDREPTYDNNVKTQYDF